MFYLRQQYEGVGVVNPSCYEFKDLEKQQKLAGSYDAFEPGVLRVFGLVNMSGVHWVAFMYSGSTCKLFDPFQRKWRARDLMTKLRRVVEPLLSSSTEIEYVSVDVCKQDDGSSCGLWCLAILELMLSGDDWDDQLYESIPYLRLRNLRKCIEML